jgi:2-amino-4-hydroxy-6-hydroxymethyldihydropteridine diphosphokinase
MNPVTHEVCIVVGSDIDPIENSRTALKQLRLQVEIIATSITWETESFGSPGPNYLNTAVLCHTPHSAEELKQILRRIENDLGRVRSSDKNAPRTIDLDIIIYDRKPLEPKLWEHLFLAMPVSGLLPDYTQPETGLKLIQIAQKLLDKGWAKPHPELNL